MYIIKIILNFFFTISITVHVDQLSHYVGSWKPTLLGGFNANWTAIGLASYKDFEKLKAWDEINAVIVLPII